MTIAPYVVLGPRLDRLRVQAAGQGERAVAVQESYALLGDGGLLPGMVGHVHRAETLETQALPSVEAKDFNGRERSPAGDNAERARAKSVARDTSQG